MEETRIDRRDKWRNQEIEERRKRRKGEIQKEVGMDERMERGMKGGKRAGGGRNIMKRRW